MISGLQKLFQDKAASAAETDSKRVETACAALMVEVMVIDREQKAAELNTLKSLIKKRFSLSDTEANELVDDAMKEVQDATSLYQFTHLINDHFDDSEKFQLVVKLWRVALADDHLDKHEEAMIRRIAELIHLPHSQFTRAKHRAKQQT